MLCFVLEGVAVDDDDDNIGLFLCGKEAAAVAQHTLFKWQSVTSRVFLR